MFSLTWLPKVLTDAGLTVVLEPGWETRGHGEIGTIKGILCHHTACGAAPGDDPSLDTVEHGRPGLAGPLAQLLLARHGTYHVVAAGKCWHAGVGIWQGITEGNTHFIGIEAENSGYTQGPLAEPWPEVQMDAYARGCAAILKHIKAPVIMCAGHKEYALPKGRKVDPTFKMDAFRDRVSAIMEKH